MLIKEVDEQGRVVLPKKWREKYIRNRKVVMKIIGDLIEITPKKEFSLENYIDSIEVDVKNDLTDWHKVRGELRKW